MPGRLALVVVLLGLSACSLQPVPPGNGRDDAAQRPSERAADSIPNQAVITVEQLPASPDTMMTLEPIPMALIWYGRTDLVDAPTTVRQVGTATRFDFLVDTLATDCNGLIRFGETTNTGNWDISCGDGSQASGILVSVRGQDAINGQGVDDRGQSVIFSIPRWAQGRQ